MIWIILGLLPIVALLLVGAWTNPDLAAGVLFILMVLSLFVGCQLLVVYGAWQMNWIEHCPDTPDSFWTSC